MALCMEGIAGWPREEMAVIGSSLGGFYATHIAEQTGCKAVLLNPGSNVVEFVFDDPMQTLALRVSNPVGRIRMESVFGKRSQQITHHDFP